MQKNNMKNSLQSSKTKKHIVKVMPLKISQSSVVKTKETGLSCIPSGEPPISTL